MALPECLMFLFNTYPQSVSYITCDNPGGTFLPLKWYRWGTSTRNACLDFEVGQGRFRKNLVWCFLHCLHTGIKTKFQILTVMKIFTKQDRFFRTLHRVCFYFNSSLINKMDFYCDVCDKTTKIESEKRLFLSILSHLLHVESFLHFFQYLNFQGRIIPESKPFFQHNGSLANILLPSIIPKQ